MQNGIMVTLKSTTSHTILKLHVFKIFRGCADFLLQCYRLCRALKIVDSVCVMLHAGPAVCRPPFCAGPPT
jgi:hypothetical protein